MRPRTATAGRTPKNPSPARMAINSVTSVRKLPTMRSIIENQPQNGPKRSKINSACPRCVAAPKRTVISCTTQAMANVSTMNGTKKPMPNRAPVAAYDSMLGPSFSPSITRMPGPMSSQNKRNRGRNPRRPRISETRSRSWARSMSSWVMTTSWSWARSMSSCVMTTSLPDVRGSFRTLDWSMAPPRGSDAVFGSFIRSMQCERENGQCRPLVN